MCAAASGWYLGNAVQLAGSQAGQVHAGEATGSLYPDGHTMMGGGIKLDAMDLRVLLALFPAGCRGSTGGRAAAGRVARLLLVLLPGPQADPFRVGPDPQVAFPS